MLIYTYDMLCALFLSGLKKQTRVLKINEIEIRGNNNNNKTPTKKQNMSHLSSTVVNQLI